jgi:P-type conjugative transfer protein TrbJ
MIRTSIRSKTSSALPSRGTRQGRRAAAAVLALALALAAAAPPAAAIIPVTDAAHIALNAHWHYVHYLQFAWQIYQQAEQIAAQAEQIRYQLLALRKLNAPVWRQVAAELGDLASLVRSGRSLGYSLADPGAEFASTYPGWQSWTDTWTTTYPQQTERALDTMRAGLAAAARQGQELAQGEQLLAEIRAQMAGTQGHQQALEQLTTLAGFSAQEQLLTRQALATQANLQAVADGYWLNKEAQSHATFAALAGAAARAAAADSSPGWSFTPAGWAGN